MAYDYLYYAVPISILICCTSDWAFNSHTKELFFFIDVLPCVTVSLGVNW